MPLPIPLLLGGGVVAALLLLNRRDAITPLPPGAPAPPPAPSLPPPPATPGQLPSLPPGFAQQANGNVVPVITSKDGTQFLASSSPESIGPPPNITSQLRPGDCMTIDVGVARLNVRGITSGNMMVKVTGMPQGNGIRAVPADPRLPSGLPEMDVPFAAISGIGECGS